MSVILPRALSSIAITLVSVCLLEAQSPAPSQQLDTTEMDLLELLNTPVTGASKREQRMIDSPQAIEVLTSDDIRQMGIYRIQDALKLMTSIDLIEGDLGYSVIGMRGVMQEGQPRTVQVLIDGVPLYTPFGSSLDINNIPLPVDLIERIEVVRGPSSTLYGANAVVGVLAITSKKLDKGVHGDLRASRADKSTSRGVGDIRWQDASGFGILAGYSGASFGNSDYRTHKVGSTTPDTMWITFDGQGTAPYTRSDKAHQSAAYARMEYRGQDTAFWLSAGKSHKMLSPVGLPSVSYMNYRFYDINTLLAGWSQTWSKTFSTEVRLHRMQNQISAGPAPTLAVLLGDTAWRENNTWGDLKSDQIDVQANWNPSDSLHFVFGLDTRKMTFGKDVMHGITSETDESASGGFASVDWNVASAHSLSLGFRAENESLGGSRVSPRFAYVWSPSKSNVLRFAYLTSTRSPQYMEQNVNFMVQIPIPVAPFLVPVFSILPNKDLKPEKTRNFEIGYRQIVGAVTLDATLYHMQFSDIINQITILDIPSGLPAPYDRRKYTRFQNTGDATNTGLELAATWAIKKGWTAGMNVAYLDYKLDQSIQPLGKDLAYTCGTKANAWTRFAFEGLFGYFGLQYMSATDVEALQVYGPSLFDKRDSIFQYHVNVGYEFLKGLSASLYVRNGAKEFTEQGATGPDRPIYYMAARREMGATLAYRF